MLSRGESLLQGTLEYLVDTGTTNSAEINKRGNLVQVTGDFACFDNTLEL